MNESELKNTILEALAQIAPELDSETLDPSTAFRDQFEFDSVDYLNFALELEKRIGVKIPETDYPKLASLDGCALYLSQAIVSK